jgi:TonB family protein
MDTTRKITLALAGLIFLSFPSLLLAQEEEISGGVTFAVVDAAPQLIYSPPVVYPEEYKAQKIEGSVELMVWVDENGEVSQASVTKPMEIEAFNQAAIEAAGKYKFKPAMQGGKPIGTWMTMTVNFKVGTEKPAAD